MKLRNLIHPTGRTTAIMPAAQHEIKPAVPDADEKQKEDVIVYLVRRKGTANEKVEVRVPVHADGAL